jgi:adenosylcobinamide-GDP ribazoletransferase
MKGLLLALQFLTIAPVRFKHVAEKEIGRSMVYFPVVGLVIGLCLAAANRLLNSLGLPRLSIDIITVICLAIFTAGMHLDGLADTCDAVLSGKNREEMLKIMRDPHSGVMGVLAVICAMLLKISLLYSVSAPVKPAALILMCVLSRWSMVLAISISPYARTEGKARVFFKSKSVSVFIFCTCLAIGLAFASAAIKGIWLLFWVAAVVYITAAGINKKIGGITGDTLGAINEAAEVAVLLGVCILERSGLWII